MYHSLNCKSELYLTYFALVTCPNLQLEYGHINYNDSQTADGGYIVDTVASFICNQGYSLTGSRTSTCQTSGNWSQQLPTCNISMKIQSCSNFKIFKIVWENVQFIKNICCSKLSWAESCSWSNRIQFFLGKRWRNNISVGFCGFIYM